MITESSDILTIFKRINKKFGLNLLPLKRIADGEKIIEELRNDKKKLQQTISHALKSKLDSEKEITQTLADLSLYLEKIIQHQNGIYQLIVDFDKQHVLLDLQKETLS